MANEPTLFNLRARLAYDGKDYLGWQKTAMGPSIEATLQAVLQQITQHPIQLQAASRTDAGVHAEGQAINFFLYKYHPDLVRLQRSINALLPEDIMLFNLQYCQPTFHSTIDAIGKEYIYQLCYDEILLPLQRHFVWHYPYVLNVALMRQASKLLIGRKQFGALTNMRNNLVKQDDTRLVTAIEIAESSLGLLTIAVLGEHFLYKMVRNIVGTLVYIGRGKITCQELPIILKSRNRRLAGITAPAHGLTLKHVFYAAENQLQSNQSRHKWFNF